MANLGTDRQIGEASEYRDLREIVDASADFYLCVLKNDPNRLSTLAKRRQLALWIDKFHGDCETLTPSVKEAIKRLSNEPCLLVMTAHQPNLFAYSGVMRKATLNHLVAEKLSESLSLPAVGFFGFADQDFTDDRWVRSALVPDVERRNGVLELRFALPEKMMLNQVGKPSREILDSWRNEIEKWIERKTSAVNRFCKALGVIPNQNPVHLQNFEGFWEIVEDAAKKAKFYSDFNAYIISHVVNDVWGYDTLFCRFSESQKLFGSEFTNLLSRFQEYSRYVEKAMLCSQDQDKGVFEQESNTLPFWLHCDCGGKARLAAINEEGRLLGYGKCIRCEKEYRIDFSVSTKPEITEILDKISARSIAMPLVFFNGLGVCCYVGGVGGGTYLRQAGQVAENMNLAFPPVVIWRPRDLYLGLGQLEALAVFKGLSGSCDLSRFSAVKASLTREIAGVQQQIEGLEAEKKRLLDSAKDGGAEYVERVKALAVEQAKIRRKTNLPALMRNMVLLKNIKSVFRLYPSIIDYVVNIGLKNVSQQWISSLEKNENLSSNIELVTSLDENLPILPRDLRQGSSE